VNGDRRSGAGGLSAERWHEPGADLFPAVLALLTGWTPGADTVVPPAHLLIERKLMSTTEVSKPTTGSARSPRLDGARLSVQASGDATEQAVSQLVRACYGTVTSLIPPVFARPTETVGLVFDVLDQLVGAGRRLSLEVAEIVEAGLDMSAQSPFAEQRAA
jgi:hypothetical protein